MPTVEDLSPAVRGHFDEAVRFIEKVREFDAADTSGPSGSRRVINNELIEAASDLDGSNEFVQGVNEFLASHTPTEAYGLYLMLSRAFEGSDVGKAAEEQIKAVVEERKANSNGQATDVAVDYTERNNWVTAARALLQVVEALDGEVAAQLIGELKVPNTKSGVVRAASGPRFKGNYSFYWNGRVRATKLAEVQKATGLSGLELKQIMARANNVDPTNDKAFAEFCKDAPAEFSFTVNFPVKEGESIPFKVDAVRVDSEPEEENLEANSEPEQDNGDEL